ncbi:MAG: hypothetical protein A2Y33_09860 [Spirochaetes bacterium GWF1_51_8]|nr:MAG: hypothetical protein A2Y33_09860 [Spirochaetes bacterium GWF1_51_8]
MKIQRIFFVPAFLLIALFPMVIPACSRIQTVTVGLITDLDGNNSHIGNEIYLNLKLFQRNMNLFNLKTIAMSAPTALSVPGQFQKLWDQGVRIFVIGHISAGVRELIEKKNPKDCLIFNLLAASQTFSGINDCFIRLVPDTKAESLAIVGYFNKHLAGKKTLVIYETANYPYTLPALAVLTNFISNRYSILGLKMSEFDTVKTAALLKEIDFDAVYLLIGGDYATQAGLLTHVIKDVRPDCSIVLSPWLNTASFMETSGKDSDGAVFPSLLPSENSNPAFREFRALFYKTYHTFPRVPHSYFAYEAMQILAECANNNIFDPEGMKKFILASGGFDTIIGRVSFDAYGDVQREYHFLTIKDGKTVYEK